MNKKRYIAFVEDDPAQAQLIEEHFRRFSKESGREFSLRVFSDTKSFEESYKSEYDLILMDIELPDGNGLELVRRLRKTDKDVLVIFITQLAHYAVSGYEVEAFDFILKPVSYYNFFVKISRAMDRLDLVVGDDVWVKTKEGKVRIKISELKYVEVMRHDVTWHTESGNYVATGSMKQALEMLAGYPFELCNRCYLVNLAFVHGIKAYEVTVGDEVLSMSHLKRTDFVRKLNLYLSGNYTHDD